MSNQFFSFSRFGKYFKFQIKLLGRGYVLAYAAALIISLIVAITLVAVDLSDHYPRPFQNEYQAIVLFGLGVVSVLMGTWMYARLNKREAMIGFLTVPASHFEKTVVSFILSFIVPMVVCILFYLICEQAMFAYFRSHALPFESADFYNYGRMHELHYYGESLWKQILDLPITKLTLALVISIYLGIHSFYVLGSLIFRRFSFVLTSISLGLLIFVSVSLVILLSYSILGRERVYRVDDYAFHLVQKWFGPASYRVNDEILLSAVVVVFLITSAVLWSVTYLKLKEKEVR